MEAQPAERLTSAATALESKRPELLAQLVERIRREADGFNLKRQPLSDLRHIIVWNAPLRSWDVTSMTMAPLGSPAFFDKVDAMKVLVVYADKLKALAAPTTD